MSFDRTRVYALDIETCTDGVNGLDPREARITEVAVSTSLGDTVFADADEARLLYRMDEFIQHLPPGLIVTWNGAFFDLPFIHDRYALSCREVGLVLADLGMHLIEQPGLKPKYDYLPGHSTGYTAVWQTTQPFGLDLHQHLDISFAYKAFAAKHGVRHSLKPVAEAHGITMIIVDREKMHELSEEDRSAYAASDTRGTRELAIRLLGA